MTYRTGIVPRKARVPVYIDEQVATALRVEAAITRESRSAIVEQALRRELERRRAERERGSGGPA